MTLPRGYYKMFFWKNLLLMKVTPILDQAVFNFPQNVCERFNIHSKILKKPFPSAFSWGKTWRYSPYCPLNWLMSWTALLSLFNFKWTFFWSSKKKSSVFTCQFHYCDWSAVSADNRPPPYNPNLPASGGEIGADFRNRNLNLNLLALYAYL